MNHLKQIAARLPEYGLDAMLLNSEPGEYYAVGFHGEGNVVVTAQGCFYFTDSRYIEAANHLITGAEIAMTGRSRNYRAMVQEVVDRCRIRKLGFEEGYLSVADYNLWKEGLTAELVPAQKLVDALRAAKDDGEIALMTKAQEITDRAFSEILKFIQPGMTEQENPIRYYNSSLMNELDFLIDNADAVMDRVKNGRVVLGSSNPDTSVVDQTAVMFGADNTMLDCERMVRMLRQNMDRLF